jgi:CRP/FNR family transcriptional regulator, anaerobic regulatory protein
MQTAAVAPIPLRVVPLLGTTQEAAFPAIAKGTCTNCNLRELCLPRGMSEEAIQCMEQVVNSRRRIKRGEILFHAGEPFAAIYSVRSGFFKTSIFDDEGREQVTGFFMGGELLGLDGLGSSRQDGTAIALEDSEVCVMPYAGIEEAASKVRALQRNLHAVLSREIVRDHGIMMLLGSMSAEERLAAFLLNLSQRFTARGYSPSEFYLRMTREEIGSYLGLKLETVSRLFSRLQETGLISVQQKHVRITSVQGLREIVGQTH